MFPEVFSTPTYWILVCAGLVVAMLVFRLLSLRFKIGDKAFFIHGMILVASILCGFICARLFQMLYDLIAGKEVQWKGGITFMGGLVGGVTVFIALSLIFCKGQVYRELWNTVCLAPLSITVAHAFGRMGCFANGCCYGKESHTFLDVTFKNHITGLPTQLFEAIFLAVLFAVLLVLVLKFKKYSLTMIVYLFSYSVFRFVIEFWRGDEARSQVGILSPSQWQSVFMFAIGAALTVYIYVLKRIPFNGKQEGKLTEFLSSPEPIKKEEMQESK